MSFSFQSFSYRPVRCDWRGAILWMLIAIGLVSCNSTMPTSAPPTETATETAIASPANTATFTPTFSLALATATRLAPPSPSPTNSTTPSVALSAPLLDQPVNRASFLSGSSVLLQWTWLRSLAVDEYFEIQLARLDAELKDWACSITTSDEIPSAPFGDGWYQWRVVARRGKINGQQCIASQDLTTPSETRTFEWRPAASSPPTQAPLPPPTPTRLPQPPPTPTKRPYP